MFTFANKPQSIPLILANGFHLYKTVLPRVWRWQLLWLLPTLLPTSVGLHSFGATYLLSKHLSSHSLNGLMIFYVLLAVLILIFGETFILSRIYNIGTQRDTHFKTSLRLAKNKFLPILGGYSITWAIMLSIFIAIGLIFGLIFLISSRLGSSSITIPSLIILIVAGVTFLMVLLFFFNVFILFENNKIIESLKNSINLVWGNWWRTLAVLLVPVVVIFITVQLVGFLVSLVTPGLNITNDIANIGVLTFLYPWFNSLILVQFNDLKLRKTLQPKVITPPKSNTPV